MLSKEQKQLYTIGLASQAGASRHTCLDVPYLIMLLSELLEYHRISSYFISYKFCYLYMLIMVHSPVSNITGSPNWLQMFSVKWSLYHMVKDIFSGISKDKFWLPPELLHYNYYNNINTHVSNGPTFDSTHNSDLFHSWNGVLVFIIWCQWVSKMFTNTDQWAQCKEMSAFLAIAEGLVI